MPTVRRGNRTRREHGPGIGEVEPPSPQRFGPLNRVKADDHANYRITSIQRTERAQGRINDGKESRDDVDSRRPRSST
jgi:hypothetical protein